MQWRMPLMRYLIDTSTISRLVRDPDALMGQVLNWGVDQIALSPIVVFELSRGMSRMPETGRKALVELVNLFIVTVFDFDDAQEAGRVDSELWERGVEIGLDALIAGHALAKNLVVITHNGQDFEQVVGLPVIAL